MTSTGTFARVAICSAVYLDGQLPGSTSTRPFVAPGLSSAASSGNDPDCECPISTAPFNWPARSDNALNVGLGVGTPPKLTSGTPCFESSSAAVTGNWVSENGWPGFDPKRK